MLHIVVVDTFLLKFDKKGYCPTSVFGEKEGIFMNQNFFDKVKEMANGCPLFGTRKKADLESLVGQVVTVDEYYPLTSKDGGYHAVTFKEDKDHVYLSAGKLKEILLFADEESENASGLKVLIKEKIPVQSDARKTFRPVEVIGHD